MCKVRTGVCNIHKEKATTVPTHPLRSDTHHRCLENICSQSCCPRGGRQHSSGPKSIIRPGWAGARRSEPNAPQGLQRRAWNFPPVGRPAQPHPIGGARWRRCEDAEVSSATHSGLRRGRSREGGRSGIAGPQPSGSAARLGCGDGDRRPSPLFKAQPSSLCPDPRPLLPLPGPYLTR